jgi:hypothetical protein
LVKIFSHNTLRLSPAIPLHASAKNARLQTFPSRIRGGPATVSRFPLRIAHGSWLPPRVGREGEGRGGAKRRRTVGREGGGGSREKGSRRKGTFESRSTAAPLHRGGRWSLRPMRSGEDLRWGWSLSLQALPSERPRGDLELHLHVVNLTVSSAPCPCSELREPPPPEVNAMHCCSESREPPPSGSACRESSCCHPPQESTHRHGRHLHLRGRPSWAVRPHREIRRRRAYQDPARGGGVGHRELLRRGHHRRPRGRGFTMASDAGERGPTEWEMGPLVCSEGNSS